MNLVKAEHRLPKILALMKDGSAEDLRFAIMRANAHEAGVSTANSQRLAAALVEAKIPSPVAMGLGQIFLGRFADAATLTEFENVVKLQIAGRLKGLDDWIAFGAKKASSDLANVVFELREAQRQVANNPKRIVHIGGDGRAPIRANGEQMRSFDQTVETSRGSVEKSIEVTTVTAPLKDDADLSPALKHGIGKVQSRMADGVPIPGEHDLSVYVELSKPTTTKKGTQVIEPDGERVLHTRNGMQVSQGNLFENMAEHMSSIPENGLLDHVTLVDRHTGRVIVEFQYDHATSSWSRVKPR